MRNFEQKVKERAFYKFLNRQNFNLPGNEHMDWEESEREQIIDEKIREEAYLHSLNNGHNPEQNWMIAKSEIMQRIQFLAFYLHENNYNKSAVENWIEAQKLYISKF